MHRIPKNQRSVLSTISEPAMISRGLEPEFPIAVQQQLSSLKEVPCEDGPDIRDLRRDAPGDARAC